MARTTTTRTRKAAKPAAKPAVKSKAAKPAAKPAKTPQERTPRGRDPQSVKNSKVIVSRLAKGEPLSQIAADLDITTGLANWILTLHLVDSGEVSTVPLGKDPVATIRRLREANDDHSAWYWIAARTGLAESQVTKIARDNGFLVKGESVATLRKDARPAVATVKKGKSTTKVAAKTGKRTRRAANPS